MLCDLLRSTGLAGIPNEFFGPITIASLSEKWGVRSLDEYIPALVANRTGPNGVFGFKLHWAQLETFGNRDIEDTFRGLRFIHIRRDDHLRQAVSWMRAEQTGEWRTRSRKRRREPVFRAEEIRSLLLRIEKQEGCWESFFRERSLSPLRLTYESMVDSFDDIVRRVLGFLEIDLPAQFELEPPIRESQSDAFSEECVRRYIALRAENPAYR